MSDGVLKPQPSRLIPVQVLGFVCVISCHAFASLTAPGRCSRWKGITARPDGCCPPPGLPPTGPWTRTRVSPWAHQPLPWQHCSRARLQLPSAWPCPAMGPAEPGLPPCRRAGLALVCPQGAAGAVRQAATLTHFPSALRRAESLFHTQQEGRACQR